MTPLKERILVRRDIAEKFSGPIELLEDYQAKPKTGTVIAVGNAVKDINEGDRIMFGKNNGVEIKINNETLLVMKENEVYGVLYDA